MSCYINDLGASIAQAEHFMINNVDEAVRILYQAVRENDSPHDCSNHTTEQKELLAKAYCLLGKLHAQKHEDFLGRENFRKALSYANSLHQQGLILLQQAEMEVEEGHSIEAEKVLHQSFNNLLGDTESLALHSCLQGILKADVKDFNGAKELYAEALTKARKSRRKIIGLILRHSSLLQKLKFWFWCRSIKPSDIEQDQEKIPR